MPELECARQLLPLWSGCGAGLWLLPISAAIGWLAARLAAAAALPPECRWRDLAWPERARLTCPARLATALAAGVAAGTTGAVVGLQHGLFSLLPAAARAALCAACAWVGGEAVALDVARRTTGHPGLGLRGELAGILLLAPGLIPLVAMLAWVRADGSAASAAAALGGIAGLGAAAVWAGVPLLRLFGAARPASPRVQRLVRGAAARAGIAPRAVFELELPSANAFALPLPGWLLFTRRCVEGLSDAEFGALCAHELGHLAEPPRVAWARAAGAFALLPLGFARLAVEGLGRGPGLLLVLAAASALALPIARMRKQLERRADAAAHQGEADAGLYARALARLGQLNALPAVGFGRGGTHPHLYDRLLSAGLAPGFPRPAPPSSRRLFAGIAASAAVLMSTLPLALEPRIALLLLAPEAGIRAALAVALTGGSPRDLYELSLHLASRGRTEEALAAIDPLIALGAASPEQRLWRAELLALAGRRGAVPRPAAFTP